MRCLLEGHKPRQFGGVGKFKGETFTVCTVCNKTLEATVDLQEAEDYVRETFGRSRQGAPVQ